MGGKKKAEITLIKFKGNLSKKKKKEKKKRRPVKRGFKGMAKRVK